MKTIFKNYERKTFGYRKYVYHIKGLSTIFANISTVEEILEEYVLKKLK